METHTHTFTEKGEHDRGLSLFTCACGAERWLREHATKEESQKGTSVLPGHPWEYPRSY